MRRTEEAAWRELRPAGAVISSVHDKKKPEAGPTRMLCLYMLCKLDYFMMDDATFAGTLFDLA